MNKRDIGSGTCERSTSEIDFVLRNAGRKTGPEILRHVAGAKAAGTTTGGSASPKARAGAKKPVRKRGPKKS